jgi:hypothetical protein
MIVRHVLPPGAPAELRHLQKEDDGLAPMYTFFNYYDNPLATYDNVELALVCHIPHIGGFRLKKRGYKTRKNAKRFTKKI